MERQLDLRELLSIVKRHRNGVYFCTCMAILFATILNLMPPTYEAKITMRIKPATKSVENVGKEAWQSEELVRQKMYTYAELIKSRAVVELAISKLSEEQQASLHYDKVVDRINVRPLKDTEILNMFVSSGLPQEAQDLANALAAAAGEKSLDIARAENKETRIFIGERLAEKKLELDEAEKALVDYKKKNKIVAVTEQSRAFVEQQSALKKLDNENQVALAAAYAKQRSQAAIVDTPVVHAYRIRLAEQEVELAGLLKTLTASHPRVMSLKAAIAENRTKLQGELKRISSGEVMRGEAQKASIQSLASRNEQESAQMPEIESGLAQLALKHAVAETTYFTLAKRYEEARINEIMEAPSLNIIDMAVLPEEPVKPKKVFNLCIALFLGLFTGVLSTFFLEYFYKTIDTVEDLRRHLSVPVIGVIPRVGARSPKLNKGENDDEDLQ